MESRPAANPVTFVFTTLPDSASAVKLANCLVDARHAACVHVLPAGRSIYRWKEKIVQAGEVTVLIKTTASRYGALEEAIRAAHPYDLPEIVAVPAGGGLPEYLEWVAGATSEHAN